MKPIAPIKGIKSLGLAVLIGSIGGFGVLSPAPATADALPNSPTNPTAEDRWVNPELRLGENTRAGRPKSACPLSSARRCANLTARPRF